MCSDIYIFENISVFAFMHKDNLTMFAILKCHRCVHRSVVGTPFLLSFVQRGVSFEDVDAILPFELKNKFTGLSSK